MKIQKGPNFLLVLSDKNFLRWKKVNADIVWPISYSKLKEKIAFQHSILPVIFIEYNKPMCRAKPKRLAAIKQFT